ncbi:MAG: hypothetical protein UT24_C0009G0154 [Candidatus Woesebacteria bacterium GW2011_GWB1_39_12]|uniref:Aminoglycoside phosphotransferase domain-containing protein n=2 Tax=Candidatus Woeseibacteriota TaxID=1752722 RepID=A0A0G0M397_9BACT|nr:MAG: hypothetical protein UT23_C0002G0153 [Candidatus Woesebacteria bacterium GW2011_GWA1_39_12]KKR00837.1 MAG: hypothetical protein UT24_C0009G0154 [Candidatus Woesebacteria bacterium GW2011_GWB1_39_12]
MNNLSTKRRFLFLFDNMSQKIAHKLVTKLTSSDRLQLLSVHSGSSNSKVYIYGDTQKEVFYAVKCVKDPRLSLFDEYARYLTLSKYYKNLPEVLNVQKVGNYEIMISNAYGTETLHRLICSKPKTCSKCLSIWSDVVFSLVDVWEQTKHNYLSEESPRPYKPRLERITKGVKEIKISDNIKLENYFNLPLKINGVIYPSLEECFSRLERVDAPSFGVLCHGDPQPSNVVVSGNGWYLVDWEWSGFHNDWRQMLSHMYGWWSYRYFSAETLGEMKIEFGRIIINHNYGFNNEIQNYQKVAVEVFTRMNGTWKDIQDINKYLGLLYFGEIRFLDYWNKQKLMPAIIAEAVKTTFGNAGQPFQYIDKSYHTYV